MPAPERQALAPTAAAAHDVPDTAPPMLLRLDEGGPRVSARCAAALHLEPWQVAEIESAALGTWERFTHLEDENAHRAQAADGTVTVVVDAFPIEGAAIRSELNARAWDLLTEEQRAIAETYPDGIPDGTLFGDFGRSRWTITLAHASDGSYDCSWTDGTAKWSVRPFPLRFARFWQGECVTQPEPDR